MQLEEYIKIRILLERSFSSYGFPYQKEPYYWLLVMGFCPIEVAKSYC